MFQCNHSFLSDPTILAFRDFSCFLWLCSVAWGLRTAGAAEMDQELEKRIEAIEITMPDLATTEGQVTIVAWQVEAGQTVERGQVLLEVETDKATMEVESVASGVVKALRAEPGDTIAAGQVIAVIESEAKSGAKAVAPSSAASASRAADAPAGAPAMPAKTSAPRGAGKRRSFFARNREARQTAGPASGLSAAQQVVARRMAQSKQSIPHFYLQTSANAEPMMALREAADVKPTWDAFFVRAAAQALKQHARMCFRYEADRLVPHGDGAVGVAVDVEDDLFVVRVGDPAALTIEEISAVIRSGVQKIREGDAEAQRIRPASITISNLGKFNVESFIAIVNPPESAILSVGKIAPQAVVEAGRVQAQSRVSLVLSADHRVVNGKVAAGFLSQLVNELEQMEMANR